MSIVKAGHCVKDKRNGLIGFVARIEGENVLVVYSPEWREYNGWNSIGRYEKCEHVDLLYQWEALDTDHEKS